MRSNPLVVEVLKGLNQCDRPQRENLGLVLLQAAVLIIMWPKSGVETLLQSERSPYTLAAGVMAMGIATAYIALRAGAEKFLLPGQHGLRDWTLATGLGMGRILRGYLSGQFVHSLYLLALSSPLLLVAFTVSGGEWGALGLCVSAALLQALFYRLCGAITHLTIGQHAGETEFIIRTILVAIYIPLGWIAPVTSHLALTFHSLDEIIAPRPTTAAASEPVVFFAIYAGLSVIAAVAVHRLLLRERRRMALASGRAGFEEVIT